MPESNGIFDDQESVFPDDVYRSEVPNEPVVTRAEEDEDLVGHMGDKRPPAPEYQELIAQWDERGNCVVAWSLNGRLQEKFRRPTEKEWALLQARGEWVKGGLQGTDVPEPAPSLLERIPRWAMLAGGVVVGAGALWAYGAYKDGTLPGMDSEEEEGDDADEEEESL